MIRPFSAGLWLSWPDLARFRSDLSLIIELLLVQNLVYIILETTISRPTRPKSKATTMRKGLHAWQRNRVAGANGGSQLSQRIRCRVSGYIRTRYSTHTFVETGVGLLGSYRALKMTTSSLKVGSGRCRHGLRNRVVTKNFGMFRSLFNPRSFS